MLLEKISSPKDLKRLSISQLYELCDEIRYKILEVVSQNGGHLAPSLGAVELIVALHYVFSSPRDKLVFDVGHQAYAHKLLTGRYPVFHTLRKKGGISGFLRPSESEHDAFGAGHASTSLAAAMGMAVARDLKGEDYDVVAIIGDGGLSGGLAWEALNNIGHLKKRLLVVLNDNEMSISKSVGAFAEYLAKMRTQPSYLRVKEELEFVLRRIPFGTPLWESMEKLKESVKHLLLPGMIFEELGFTYLGPIDGHNIEAMVDIFGRARRIEGPVIIHILTKKGKGYPPAEKNPEVFHGISPFDLETGLPKEDGIQAPYYSDVFSQTIVRIGERNNKVVTITAAMPLGVGLKEFSRRFPERFFDTGMGEGYAVTFAAGLASQGLKPVVAIYSTFLQRAYDMILHDVCLQDLPVVFAIDRAGIVGEDGATHHGLYDIAYLRSLPNIVISAPTNEWEFASLLETAIEYNHPFAIRYPRARGLGIPYDNPAILPIGKGEVAREGEDICIIALGSMYHPAQEAVRILEGQGIKATLINPRFVKPLDEELILSYASVTKQVLIVEEGIIYGGLGSAVLELLAQKRVKDVAVAILGVEDVVEHGTRYELLESLGLSPQGIVEASLKMLK